MVLVIPHHNHSFQNNEHANLLATGPFHHIILLR